MTSKSLPLTSSRTVLQRFLRVFLAKRFGILLVIGESAVEREDVCSALRSCIEPWQTVQDVRSEDTALAFRAALRMDPDLVFVGEVKDADLARDVAHASLLGHLLVVTAQGTDRVRILTRLARLVGNDFLFASSLLGILVVREGLLEGSPVSTPLREALTRGEEGEKLELFFQTPSLV